MADPSKPFQRSQMNPKDKLTDSSAALNEESVTFIDHVCKLNNFDFVFDFVGVGGGGWLFVLFCFNTRVGHYVSVFPQQSIGANFSNQFDVIVKYIFCRWYLSGQSFSPADDESERDSSVQFSSG